MAAITQHPTAKTDFANPTTSQIIFIRKREVMRRTGLSSTGIYDLMAWIDARLASNKEAV